MLEIEYSTHCPNVSPFGLQEPRWIAHNAASFLIDVLRQNEVTLKKSSTALVAGYGAIGKAVALACKITPFLNLPRLLINAISLISKGKIGLSSLRARSGLPQAGIGKDWQFQNMGATKQLSQS